LQSLGLLGVFHQFSAGIIAQVPCSPWVEACLEGLGSKDEPLRAVSCSKELFSLGVRLDRLRDQPQPSLAYLS
jgi:hypothetical protein